MKTRPARSGGRAGRASRASQGDHELRDSLSRTPRNRGYQAGTGWPDCRAAVSGSGPRWPRTSLTICRTPGRESGRPVSSAAAQTLAVPLACAVPQRWAAVMVTAPGDLLGGRSAALVYPGRAAEAADDARRSLALARELGYPGLEAVALACLSAAARHDGDQDGAIRLAHQAQHVPGEISGVQEMNYAARRVIELQAPWSVDDQWHKR